MHPVLFHLGPVTITCFGLMMALAFFVGLWNWVWLGRREGRDFNACSDLLMWIMIAGVVGARAAYVASDWAYFVEEPARIFRVDQGGLIFYGGLIGAGAGLWGYARLKQQRLPPLVDFVVMSLPLGHALGRVGCLLNGCCFGRRYDGALSVTYPMDSFAWFAHVQEGWITRFAARSLSVHAIQLYEAAVDLAIYGVLLACYRRPGRRDGRILGLYLLLYPALRFGAEFLRGDERVRGWLGLNVAQNVSLALMVAGALVLWRAEQGARDAQTRSSGA